MILVERGKPDADGAEKLAAIETRALTDLRAIVSGQQRNPTVKEIERHDYTVAGTLLCKRHPYGADRGFEQPVLLDPPEDSGVEHIEYRRIELPGGVTQWRPVARNGSVRGDMTIWLCGLDRDGLIEAYEQHVIEEVKPRAHRFEELHPLTSDDEVRRVWEGIERELYRRSMPFVGLSYDVLRVLVPDDDLAVHKITRRVPR